MNKNWFFFAVLLAVMATSLAFSSPRLQKKHRGLKKDDQIIDCSYCHGVARVPQGSRNYNKQKETNPGCQGSGCHKATSNTR